MFIGKFWSIVPWEIPRICLYAHNAHYIWRCAMHIRPDGSRSWLLWGCMVAVFVCILVGAQLCARPW